MLTTGNTWALAEHRHPPLLNMWNTLPLLLQPERPEATTVAHWESDFVQYVRAMWPLFGPIERLELVTRFPTMLLAILLMALVYRWGRQLFGHRGGMLGIFVMTFEPTLVAHAQLNTTDLGATLFGFGACYLAAQLQRKFSIRGLIGTGLLTGAAIAAKGSGVMVAPIVLLTLLIAELQIKKPPLRALMQWGSHSLILLCVGLLLVWGTYRFKLEPLPNSQISLPLVNHIQMTVTIFNEAARTAFLWGELHQGGWWWYFPFAFAIKTPIPVILLLLATGFTALRNRAITFTGLLSNIPLWLYPSLYAVTAMISKMNIGYRHLLPIFPFAFVAIGSLGKKTDFLVNPWKAKVLSGLLLWQAIGTLWVYPFPIAYFNELIGGAREGYHYLVDSNVDWGQSFKALHTYMDAGNIAEVKLSYYTWIDPAVYGINYQPLPPSPQTEALLPHPYNPEPGIYALSATTLQGVMVADENTYAWFRERRPVAQPGYGLLVYEVPTLSPPPGWVAQCTVPVAPLDAEAIQTGFGPGQLRTIAFDCTQSWIYPESSGASGWYVLHRDIPQNASVFLQARLNSLVRSYQQRRPGRLPAFTIYQQADSTQRPQNPDEIAWDNLTFLGYTYTHIEQGQSLNIETWWRVENIPQRPLSLMLHVSGPAGSSVIVGDGLGVPLEMWQVGDIIVQQHHFILPATTATYAPLVGVYWLDTLERWPVRSGPHTGETAISLPPINIK